MHRRTPIRYTTRAVAALWLFIALSGHALAHGASIEGSSKSLSVPLWLFILTSGGVVSASFLLASFITDRSFIREIHDWQRFTSWSADTVIHATKAIGVLVLLGIIAAGWYGPPTSRENIAIIFVWVGWWAAYTTTVYIFGNTWPALNPWRTIGNLLPSLDVHYPERLGAWPSVVGLLALIWLEVLSPLASEPKMLADIIVAYSLITLAGTVVFTTERWFSTVDPVARVFRYYGRVAPFHRTESGFEFQLPGARLTETKYVTGIDEVAFIIAILWVTTYDGFVSTPLWADIEGAVTGAGVPRHVTYLAALLGGFLLFLGAYRLAARLAHNTADTYLTTSAITRKFAPSLLPIAVGYHLAHYVGYFLSLSPTLLGMLSNPINPPQPIIIVLPPWWSAVNMAFILIGHLLAVWVAHATAYEVFPSRMQAIRSQYPLVAVMILYTMTSMWVVSQPTITPP
ncbi:hypothetical protein A4G99_13720 [Haladaptatus sp. R4]|uniref:hypothetical protein n=1 Tax=Haladaptatus sp. R4 TaxID=1679489 RepID=UPI0007B4E37D|nr:hypothetical protein [Haladaptatus sp. R4]KZN23888.1 hypothetical protein A4G99_13720 [Haladaptatus sp. R4]